jgi:hypothetical protein
MLQVAILSILSGKGSLVGVPIQAPWAANSIGGEQLTAMPAINHAAGRALHYSVIKRYISAFPSNSREVQSHQDAICPTRPLTITTTLRKEGRDVGEFQEKAWFAHRG